MAQARRSAPDAQMPELFILLYGNDTATTGIPRRGIVNAGEGIGRRRY
jgi:hypothetical protein